MFTMIDRRLVVLILLLAGFGSRLSAQQEERLDVRRPQATRAELEAGLASLQQIIASPAYSKSLRRAKEVEAELVKQRLAEGDFQVGDQIAIQVFNEQTLTGKFTVLGDHTITLPQLQPISVKGVLRSEIRDYLTKEIGKYVKDPQVTIQGSYIRLSVMGGVGRPGYYSFPADTLVSEAIMAAGGPAGGVRMDKSVVKRNGEEVIPKGEVQRAIELGLSLDQLNLHGGDELYVDYKQQGGPGRSNFRQYFWPIQGIVSLTFLLIRVL
jgi:protein involved in polysaccharide export with SLBB domain